MTKLEHIFFKLLKIILPDKTKYYLCLYFRNEAFEFGYNDPLQIGTSLPFCSDQVLLDKISCDLALRKQHQSVTAIDVGAHVGEWTKEFLNRNAGANIIMIEPQKSKMAILGEFAEKHENICYLQCLVGAEDKTEETFYDAENSSSVLKPGKSLVEHGGMKVKSVTKVKMRTIDSICEQQKISKVDVIKIDVQGFEMAVLEGAKKSLENVIYVNMEVNLGEGLYECSSKFDKVVKFMYEQGFSFYDIGDLFRYPDSGELSQIDCWFRKQ